MTYTVPCNYQEFTLLVKVKTTKPEKIHLILKDEHKINTVYTDRWKTIDGECSFFVRVPISGKSAILLVYNERNGIKPSYEDRSFQVLAVDHLPLEKKMDLVDFNEDTVKSFIRFFSRFCYNAGTLTAGNYISNDRKFEVQYVPTILSSKTGKEMNTPARIGKDSGVIQISQKKFVPMTIPMRMAIGTHEFSHFYVNENMNDESEADLNGLILYLGLGFPRVEAFEAYLKTFIDTPTPQNKARYDKIKKFIDNFERNNVMMYE